MVDLRSVKGKDGAFVFQTSFNPIFGVDEDLSDFIEEFSFKGSPRFVDFIELWRKNKILHIIQGRTNQEGLYDILGCIFYRLVDRIQPSSDRNLLMRICALYLMYGFYGKQPIRNHVRFRFCIETWQGALQLVNEAREEGHLEVYYIFRKLCASNAFWFCHTRQALYPGVPLFDSPVINPDTNDELGSTEFLNTKSRRYLLTQCLPAVKALQSPSTELNQAIQCLHMSLARYTDAKLVLTNQISGHCDETEPGDQDLVDGLDLITYPDSLNRLEAVSVELDKSIDEYCTKSRLKTTKSQPLDLVEPSTESLNDSSSDEIQPESQVSTNDSTMDKFAETDTESVDLGLRRRLLKNPLTWSDELNKQSESVRQFGYHLNRRRPTEPKMLSVGLRRKQSDQNK